MSERKKSSTSGLVRAGELPLLKGIAQELQNAPSALETEQVFKPDLVESELIRPEDLAYTHSVFVQCFMPVRHNQKNRQRWQTDCGNASLVIRAGELVKPDSPRTFKECLVPAGPKA